MSFVRGMLWAVLAALWAGTAAGQVEAQGVGVALPPQSVGAALVDKASRADVVFVGQVQKIERKGGVVEVVFSVEEQVVGSFGGSYTLREWAGLWTGGRTRYFVGQRAMVFLHAPGVSKGVGAGLSSPVDGMEGVLPVVVRGADVEPLVDVRWLAAGVERRVGVPLGGDESGAITLTSAKALVRGGTKAKLPEPVRLPLRPMPIVDRGEGGAR